MQEGEIFLPLAMSHQQSRILKKNCSRKVRHTWWDCVFCQSLNYCFNQVFLGSLKMRHVCSIHGNKTPQRKAKAVSLCTTFCSFAIFIWFEIYFELIPRVMSVAQYWLHRVLKQRQTQVLHKNTPVFANLDPTDLLWNPDRLWDSSDGASHWEFSTVPSLWRKTYSTKWKMECNLKVQKSISLYLQWVKLWNEVDHIDEPSGSNRQICISTKFYRVF